MGIALTVVITAKILAGVYADPGCKAPPHAAKSEVPVTSAVRCVSDPAVNTRHAYLYHQTAQESSERRMR